MITLCMDTSHVFLALALIQDDRIIGKVQESCWKRQSEEIFPKLEDMMQKAGLKPADIDQCVITEGPGSYTGIRIAMTVGKVFCALRNIPIYTLSTLQLYAGMEDDCWVLLDARGHRAYTGRYQKGTAVLKPAAVEVDELKKSIKDSDTVIGDGHLIGREDQYPDLAENFLALKNFWKKADNVHLVRPDYLKESEEYRKNHA